jgi:3-methyl-2-oxobutanoate hydroxymethyltransferase
MSYLKETSRQKKLTTRKIRSFKRSMDKKKQLEMLTCYDFQTAQMLNETQVDLILVGDSLGNVVLGYDTTVSVSLEEMKIFGAAVKRGAPDKFVILDLPFGAYSTFDQAVLSAVELFKHTKAEAIKLEGGFTFQLEIIERLTQIGVPVMGHIGLMPQSVHQQGGYYTHGKQEDSRKDLLKQAMDLQAAGVFSIVLECIDETVSKEITDLITIPTIGIGAGTGVDGQVLVINDLLKMGKTTPPKFCTPIADLYKERKDLIEGYLCRQ